MFQVCRIVRTNCVQHFAQRTSSFEVPKPGRIRSFEAPNPGRTRSFDATRPGETRSFDAPRPGQTRSFDAPKPVITIPVKVQERAVRRHQQFKNVIKEADREKLKNRAIIIRARKPELHHHKSQTYGRFDTVPLASGGWHHRKSFGDHFQINPFQANEAISYYKRDTQSEPNKLNKKPSFTDYKLDPRLISSLHSNSFTKPTNIQHEAIPKMLEHGENHTLIAAETGNGKTLCLLVPMIQNILMNRDLNRGRGGMNSPQAVVVTPGRELADQIYGVASRLGESLGIKVAVQKGGNVRSKILNPNMHHQEVDILIGTLGGLHQMFQGGLYKTENVTQMALDEIDSLIDDTFKDDLLNFLNLFGHKGQSMISGVTLSMTGATFPTNFDQYLSDAIEVEDMLRVSTKQLHRVLPHIPQKFMRVAPSRKDEELLTILQKDDLKKQKILIFCNTSSSSNFVNHYLNDNNIPCINFNATIDWRQRHKHLEQFMTGEINVLAATDLASRGIDTGIVNHVINFDYPLNMADYLHRAGRVGRVGSVVGGKVTNLVDGYIGVEMVQALELAVRKNTELPAVNANIVRIIKHRNVRREKGTLPHKKQK